MECEFLLVEGDFELGAVLVAAHFGVAGAFDVLLDTAFQLLSEGSGLVKVVTVDFDRKRVVAASAHASAAVDLICYNLGVLGKATAQFLLHLEDCAASFVLLRGADCHAYFVVGC